MRTTMRMILATMLCSGVLCTAEAAEPWMGGRMDTGLYLGGGAGYSKSNIDASGFAGDVDDSDTGWKLFAGYQFNRYLAVEAGYYDLGKVSFSGRLTTAVPPFPAGTGTSGNFDSKAYAVAAVVTLPVWGDLSLLARLGVARGEQEGDVTTGGIGASAKDETTELTYGLGASYAFARNLGIRAQWERFRVGGEAVGGKNDVDLYSIDLLYRFR